MGDGFSDARREARQQDEHYQRVDSFFDAITLYVSGVDESCTKTELRKLVETYDTSQYRNACSFAPRRHDKRVRAWMKRIKNIQETDTTAWAILLTEAKMCASDKCFRRMHETSPFSGKPIIVIVPNGEYREPAILGDYRQLHDLLSAGSLPFACTVKMPERAVKGIRSGNEDAPAKEIRESGWDDIRFISF